MKIPFLDLHKQYNTIKPEIDEAVQKVLDNQFFILGKEVEAFEKEFAQYLGVKYVVGVGSGTDGLILALWALGIGKGDEVITPVNSFIATTIAIIQVGATPVFVDMDKDTYQLDVKQVEEKITKKTKAILPVHLYGASCDMQSLLKIAKKYKVQVVEDACQAHGAMVGNKKVGTLGSLGVFSFYPGKNLGAYGDGGAISTNDEKLYKKLLQLRNYGQSKKYYHDEFGINSRLDEIQAAVLRIKLMHLDHWNKERNMHATQYKSLLKNIKKQEIIKNTFSNYHVFVIEVSQREKFQKFLLENGILTLIHYPVPIHLQKVYKHLGYKKGDFPVAEKAADRIVSLPMYSELTKEQIEYVAEKINKFADL